MPLVWPCLQILCTWNQVLSRAWTSKWRLLTSACDKLLDDWTGLSIFQGQRRKSVHNHHRRKIFWRTFLASKKNFPGWWWIQKPYKNQENHIHHRNLSSVDPIFSAKKSSALEQGNVCFIFPNRDVSDFFRLFLATFRFGIQSFLGQLRSATVPPYMLA